ncbi:MAG: hypothetical protein RBR07_08990, partial [Arcobacteraceae bacterium]|nr:hypothetical protein [Arcobacteraceae bacterium]
AGIGNDTLGGGSGDDYLYGESGDDFFVASSGSDFIDGGGESEVFGDTLDFSGINAKIALTLAEDGDEGRAYEDGVATHRVYNIENIIASDLDSTLKGNSNNNTLKGGAGDDTLSGGAGTNYLDGGAGVNTVDYSLISNDVVVDLSKISQQEVYINGATTVKETLINIQNVNGGTGNDTITGSLDDNSLFGGLGSDTIVGSGGDDILDGGDGIDVASYASATEDLNIDLGVSGTPVAIGTGYGNDTFISIEGAIGGSGDDTITGTNSSNVLIGGAGDDTLLPNGNDGINELDEIDGGIGTDFVSFDFGDSTSVILDLADGGIQNTGKGRVQIVNVENVEGGSGADRLYGNSSDNVIEGGIGDDTLFGRGGNNTLDGGADTDTADYSGVDSVNGIITNLNLLTEQVQNNGYLGRDTLISIEHIIGTNNTDIIQGNSTRADVDTMVFELGGGNDTIYAGSGANLIYTARIASDNNDNNTVYSGTGNDTVYGSNGADKFIVTSANDGQDTFYGRDGINTIDYSAITDTDTDESTGGIVVTLNGSTNVAVTLKNGGDTNIISNVQHIVGTANSDTITGDTNNNILDGGAGDDTIFGIFGTNTLYGGAGNDSITGGTAVDTIYGGDGDDTIFSSTGNDTIYGGDGLDTMDFSGRSGTKVFVNLAQNQVQVDTNSNGEFDLDDEKDVLYGISRVVGSTGNDTLYGDTLDNILEGNAGINSLYGAGGDDTLIGGTGTDIAYYTPAGSSVYVDMTQEYQVVRDGDSGRDKLTNIDYIYGSDFGDTFLGNGDNNTFLGSVGNDTFYSSTGTNVHNGGADSDLFIITSKDHGEDTLIGGLGSDTVDFSQVSGLTTKGLEITLNGNETVQATLNDVNSHKLTSIENITGTIYNDTITGDHNTNIIRGFAGDNTLIGGAGDDTLIGGTGTDVASYETSDSGINVDLTQVNFQVLDDGLGGRDKLDGIDTIIGSDYADTFKGSIGSDTFIGGSGDDWFIGSAGDDYFEGGTTSSDTVDYSDAITDLVVDINDGSKYINAQYGTDTFLNINGIVGGSGDDTLIGNSGRNTLVGGSGDDTLLGYGGDDYIDGGSGSDFVSFAYTAKDIELDLAITDAQDTNDGMLTIKNIQNIAGGAGSDTIYGNNDNNILSGGYGNDTLSGRGGNNTLIGGLNGFELTLGAIIVGTVYSFAIEGQTISYTAQGGDTKADVLEALEDTFKANGIITNSYIVNDGEKLYIETNDGSGTLALSNITSITESFVDIADYSINPYNGIKVNLSLASNQVYDNGNGGSDTLIGIEQLKGSNYADTFIGSDGNDTIYGGAGNDTFTGGLGNDTFYGETGDDLFISSYNDGDNTYYGGTTDEVNGDTIDYSGITDSQYKVVGDLSNSNISVNNSLDVLQKTDTIYNIENLTGGAGDDTLRGNTSKNTLKGGSGDDTLYVSEGGDRLFGEAGNDTFIFEDGIDASGAVLDGGTTSQTTGDVIDYSDLTDGVSLRLMGTSYSAVTVGVTTNHHTIRNINNIMGSQGDDTIEGDSSNNVFDGNSGTDTIVFENAGAKVVANIGNEVTLNSITYTANQATGATIGTDTITNFENITGGSGDDTLIGNSGINIIYGGIGKDFIFGGEGDDKLYGEDGDDLIAGGEGHDTIDGGEGSDTVTYADASSVIVNLRGATYGSGYVTYGVDEYTDKLYSIENVTGSDGDDTIQGNETNNTLDGAAGINTVSYSGAASGVVVNLGLQGQTQDTIGDGVDYLANFANLIGSSQVDILSGDANSNMINGGAGDDTIYGIGGSNYLYGGTGDDTIYGKVSGSDFVDGGTGNNKIDYSNLDATNSIVVNLSQTTTYNDENGDSQTVSAITVTGGNVDYIKNINVVEGSQGNDIITGNSGNNTLIGGEGNDTLNGYAGNNLLIGGDSTNGDWADYSNRQQIKLDLSSGLSTVDSNSSGNFEPTDDIDTLIGIENIYGSNLDTYADDTIVGNDYSNTIFGQKGDDTIDGGRGDDYLDGGDGSDTVSFASVTGVSGIKVNIGASDIIIGSDTIEANTSYRNTNISEVYNFENIQGSTNSDILIGSNTSNEIYGGDGNDTIYGGEGDNYLFGEAGADTFLMGGFFGSGSDYINSVDGGSGADVLDYSRVTTGAISVTLDGEEEVKVSIYSDNIRSSIITDTYDMVKNIRNIVGTSGNDSIKGDGSANILDGGAGDDVLDGGAGDDSLIGGAGNDTLISVSGNNLLDGGTNTTGDGSGDWVYYNQKL